MDRERAEAYLRMLPVVLRLSRDTDRTEVIAAGRSAEVRATLPVRWP